MRRHATMGVAFALPLVVSVIAVAQPTRGAAVPTAGAPSAASAAKPTTAAAGSSAPASAGAGATGPAAGTAPAGMDGATYAVRLRDLESRVDELKDQIRRSHTRLSLLSDTIISGGIAGARSDITFRNEMSSAFRLVKAVFVVDGAIQYNKQDETGVLADQKEISIFNAPVPPGDHTVQASLSFKGHGYGVFTYLRGYRFEVKATHSFTITEGKAVSLTAVAVEKGDATTPLEQRPAVEWREHVGNLLTAPAPVAAEGAASAQPRSVQGKASGTAGPGTLSGSAGGSFSTGGGKK